MEEISFFLTFLIFLRVTGDYIYRGSVQENIVNSILPAFLQHRAQVQQWGFQLVHTYAQGLKWYSFFLTSLLLNLLLSYTMLLKMSIVHEDCSRTD